MPSRLEEKLQRDVNHIREKIIEMGELAEAALRAGLRAINESDRRLAYSVVLRDRHIDDLEKELDRLCQQFLVTQLPAGGLLRFVYAVSKINNELERVGDYAESIARQFLAVSSFEDHPPYEKFNELAHLSIQMLCSAIRAFVENDVELAKATRKMEKKVDRIRYSIHRDLISQTEEGALPSDVLLPFVIIANRFERVADQSCNICEQVLYMCTGEDVKHGGDEPLCIIFVDKHGASRARMAEGIANSLSLDDFHFTSAGISPSLVDLKTVQFLKEKGIEIPEDKGRDLQQALDSCHPHVIVALCKEAEVAFPTPPTKKISISWSIEDISNVKGGDAEIQSAYENAFGYLNTHIRDLVDAIQGDLVKKEDIKIKKEEK